MAYLRLVRADNRGAFAVKLYPFLKHHRFNPLIIWNVIRLHLSLDPRPLSENSYYRRYLKYVDFGS